MPLEKQQTTALNYVDFSGGENSAVPPNALQDNEYQVIRNFEFNFNKLVTRGGLSAPLHTYTKDIKAIHYDEGTNTFIVVLTDNTVWEEDLANRHIQAGTLTGTKRPSFCEFDGRIFIASGGKLQYYDYTLRTLTTIATSPICDQVFERFGRLVVSAQGDDNLYYSATGDPYEHGTPGNADYFNGWKDESDDDSTAKFIEVGYKDNGDILKVVPIAGDIAVFKTNGRVYTLSGEYPSWSIQQIAEHTDVANAEAIANVGSDVMFMTNTGLKSLATTATYGNFTTSEIARKINRSLAENVNSPRVYNLIRKRQLIVFPDTVSTNALKKCYCFHYDIGAGIRMEFAYPIADIQETRNGVVVACGKSLHHWGFDYATDNGTPIEQEIVSKRYDSSNRLFTRSVDVGIKGTDGGLVVMNWANKTINYKINAKRRVINVFSMCRDSVFRLTTKANVSIEYIKLYLFEGE